VTSFLAEGGDTIVLGDNADEQIEISAIFLKDEAPISVLEEETSEEDDMDSEQIELVDDDHDDEEWDEEAVLHMENGEPHE